MPNIVQVKNIDNIKRFKMELLDIERFVKVNNCREITNPIYFIRPGIPTSDGLLSNEIFGITKSERSGTFAYIDLHSYFINPIIYKIWSSMNRNIRECAHGTKNFIVNDDGDLVEDSETGDTGIDFLRKNIDKIKIKETDSRKRSIKIKFIENNKDKIFIKKMIVIPAFFRDVKTSDSAQGVGEINKLYDGILIAVNALKETVDYGLYTSNSSKGRIQELLIQIYDWFSKEPNLSKKNGIIRRAGMSKTTDYASRLVISAPNIRVESVDDLTVNTMYSSLPLASACANFFPFMVFTIRRFFENEFANGNEYSYIGTDKQIHTVHVKDPMINFSDEEIKKQIERYIKGTTNRFIPVEIPNDIGTMYMVFKGSRWDNINKIASQSNELRYCTWCDILYMAACEVVKNRCILITRYPFDSYFSQFPTLVNVASTLKTECVMYNGVVYPNYPYIRNDMLNKDTSDKFLDTLRFSNVYLKAIGGDYDGDQVTVKGIFSDEANAELINHIKSKKQFIGANATNTRITTNEGIQVLYSLTLNLPDNKLTNPEF